MFVTGTSPSAGVNWLALSRDANPGGPPTMPPAWALPCSGSFLQAALVEVESLGVERRLGEAEDVRPVVHPVVHRVRFARAASMSFCCSEVNEAGLQRDVNHWFVHGYT